MGRIQDGTEARRLLSRLLLGIDGSPVCLWRDEPVMGRLYQRLCPAREDHPREPIGQPPWRSFVHWLGSMDSFWLVLTFTDYLGRVRVEKAKNLLLNPHLRVSEIAYTVDFQSLTHFNRLFR